MPWTDGDVRREKIVVFIQDYIELNEQSPSRREIAKGTDMAVHTVARHLTWLIEHQKVSQTSSARRNLRIGPPPPPSPRRREPLVEPRRLDRWRA